MQLLFLQEGDLMESEKTLLQSSPVSYFFLNISHTVYINMYVFQVATINSNKV